MTWVEEDDGSMADSVANLASEIVGRRIVKIEQNASVKHKRWYSSRESTSTADAVLTLDDGTRVGMLGLGDCCAYTSLDNVIEKLPTMDHVITNVISDESFNKWHILAGMDEVLELDVSWSAGNPFYYAFGFEIVVEKPEGE